LGSERTDEPTVQFLVSHSMSRLLKVSSWDSYFCEGSCNVFSFLPQFYTLNDLPVVRFNKIKKLEKKEKTHFLRNVSPLNTGIDTNLKPTLLVPSSKDGNFQKEIPEAKRKVEKYRFLSF
jgi:hypothetical protein